MRLNTLAATATIAVLAMTATACKSSSHAPAAAPATNAPATQTQADDTSSQSASSSPSSAASPASSPSASASASSAPAAAAGGKLDACSLLTGAQASSLTGRQFGAGATSTIAAGQDQCDYPYQGTDFGVDLIVIVYEPTSGVSWDTMSSVLSGVGTVMQVSGVGDKAMFAGVELDLATGKWLVAIQGADPGVGQDTGAIAIGKELVGALASK
jgi:hypothetical protein